MIGAIRRWQKQPHKDFFSTEYINLVAYKQALNPIAEKLREQTNIDTSHLFTMPTFITKQEVEKHPNPEFDYLLKLSERETLDFPEGFCEDWLKIADPQKVIDNPDLKCDLEEFITALSSQAWVVQNNFENRNGVFWQKETFGELRNKCTEYALSLQLLRKKYDWDIEYAVLPFLNFATNKPLLIDTKDKEEARSFCEDKNKIMDYIDNLNWSPIVKSSEVYVQKIRVFMICKNLRVKRETDA